MNNFVGVGRSATDVELRYTQGGLAIASFTIALDRGMSKAKKEEAISQGKQTADFLKVVVFDKTAEFVGNYLKKGKQVAVSGKMQNNNYEDKDGKKIYGINIVANQIEVLEFADKELSGDSEAKDFHPTDTSEIPF